MTSTDRRETVRTNVTLPPRYPRPAIYAGATGRVTEDHSGLQVRVYFPEYGMSYLVDRTSLDTVPDGIYVGTRTTSEAELVYGEFIETDDDGSGIIVTDSGTFPVLADTVMPVTTESRYTAEELTSIVDLWERLCAITTGETAGEYLYSTRYLSTHAQGNTTRMPDATEIRALVLSNGEETEYPKHGEFEDGRYMDHVSPWSYGDQLYPITLTLISCGDYHGSDLDSANNRALDQNFVGVDVSYPNTGGMGSVESVSTVVVGTMSVFGNSEREEIENLKALVEALEGLTDYPLLDEEIHSDYVSSLAEDTWDQYLSSDIQREIVDLVPASLLSDDTDAVEVAYDLWDANFNADSFRNAYYEFEDNEWIVESGGATNVINDNHPLAVAHAARVVFGWETCQCSAHCLVEGCSNDPFDGEGFDGRCGSHADVEDES